VISERPLLFTMMTLIHEGDSNLSVEGACASEQLHGPRFCLSRPRLSRVVQRTSGYRAFILTALASLFVTIPPQARGHQESTITKQMALSIATSEVRRQRFVLPRGYETKVTESTLRPDAGPKVALVSVTFYAGRQAHNVSLYLVSIDRTTGTVLFVDNLIAHTDMTPEEWARFPLPITVQAAVRIATKAIRKRALVIPRDSKTDVTQSTISYRDQPDKHVFIVSFKTKTGNVYEQLYKVAINRLRGNVEFVFDYVAKTIE
jgi:hypothetical protein